MRSKKLSVASFVPAVVSLLLAIGVMTVFVACGPKEDGTWMHCHDAQIAVAICGAVATVVYAVAAFVGGGTARTALLALGAVICIVALVLPGIMPLCAMGTMRCQAVMAPFARVVGALGGIAGIVGAVVSHRENTKDLPRYGRL